MIAYVCVKILDYQMQPGERNVVDQRLLELTLWEEHKIQVFRLSLAEVCAWFPLCALCVLCVGFVCVCVCRVP
jgi:hypothetical protein